MKLKVLVVMKLVIYEKNDEHHYDVRHSQRYLFSVLPEAKAVYFGLPR